MSKTSNLSNVVNNYINVKDFGAVGDGTTDDTAAIRAAVDSGAENIYFPDGDYLMSERVVLHSNQTLCGAATIKAAQVLVPNPDSWAATHWAFFTGHQISNVAVHGLRFEVVDTLAKPGAGGVRGVTFVQCEDILVDGCSFYGKGGITGMISCSRWTVTNCNVVITVGWADGGIDQWSQTIDSRDFCITNNHVDGGNVCPWTILVTGFTGLNLKNFTISNNTCRRSLYTAIWVNGRNGINDHFVISNNCIRDSHQGIRLSDCNGGVVANNVISDSNYQAIILDEEPGEGATSANYCQVVNNVLRNNNKLNNPSQTWASGIALGNDSSHNIIASNTIVSPNQNNAISLDNAVSFNTLRDNYYTTGGIKNESSQFNYIIEDHPLDSVSVLDYIPDEEHAAIRAGTSTYDCTTAIQTAIEAAKTVVVPIGKYRVTSTITVGTRGRALVGETPIITTRPDQVGAEIFYDGSENNLLPLIKLGANNVGAQPDVDATACAVQNLILNCNNKAGFGIYGTYVTNESLVDRVTVYNAREYGMYIAKSWYATYTNIFVRGCRGNGIALGMPLVLLDGTDYSASWTGPAFELNGVRVENLRTATTGTYFSDENPGTWDPSDANKRMKGYGLGVGVGNGLVVSNVTLEKAGGTLLYMRNSSNPVKVIDGGYLEGAAVNAGLDPTVDQPGIIIDNVGASGTGIEIRDLFFNFNTGGIYHTGSLTTKVWLKNLHQPRFLKSLDGVGSLTLWATVLKENVRYECGSYNTLESLMSGAGYGVVNTRYSFTVDLLPSGGYKAIYLKGDGTVPIGSYTVTYDNGTTTTHAFPSGLGTSFVLDRVVGGSAISITKSGPTDTYNSDVAIKVMDTPSTIS